ncbi:ankyrin repeat-containing protein ITN1-like isoform X2 [Solanum dulcamara]|uniref:ankyrin repeat-containing protein ITN1-like isoform X2 n=1 Tax=Solanum dulcamara TaxID=45834 RepID=UPI0024863F47|nr:ankyrin repeat-containing protein ITN1-like isoform X2 [Solanum dulcamara]
MEFLSEDERKHDMNKKLYDALMKQENDKVIQLCRGLESGPLHKLTVHDDTVLHVAAYSKQTDLVLCLLKELEMRFPEFPVDGLKHRNDMGNTILHEIATFDRVDSAAKIILNREPDLLGMRNKNGETALFRAVRYGKTVMFHFLDEQVNHFFAVYEREACYYKLGGATILHAAVRSEHFGLALSIAKKYEYLVNERDADGMTALQLLACNRQAFGSGEKYNYIKRSIYTRLSTEHKATEREEAEKCYRVPLVESMRKQKQRYESVLKLAKFLIAKDTSWEYSESALNTVEPRSHKYRLMSDVSKSQEKEEQDGVAQAGQPVTKIAESPLILATKSGCTEIVDEILKTYPQAVEYVDSEGRNVLHVAIKYRQMQIFDIVEKMGMPMRRLKRKITHQGNSILHMVGVKEDTEIADMRSPALLLQENLLLFERVKNVCSADFFEIINEEGKTAEELFTKANATLRSEAKDWLKRTSENCTIVAVLIATVAFAAAYTIPGGPNQSTGYPVLLDQPFFVIFTIGDVLSITFALTSMITFLSILTSSFLLHEFRRSLPQKLILGVTLLILSVSMMMLAFASTIILMIHYKERWTKVALSSMAFLPVTIFAVSYFPLYLSLWKNFNYSLRKLAMAFPRCKILSGKPRNDSLLTSSSSLHESESTKFGISTSYY